MAYIGNSPANVGNYQEVDDISSSFNGSTTSFNLLVDSAAITPAKSGQLLVSVNGVMQEPDDTGTNGFKVSGSTIVFSAAPATSSTFWAMYQGQNVDVGTPSAGVVGTAQMSSAELELSGGLGLGDNVKAQFGAGNDLQIYHDASDSWIVDNGTGGLKFGVSGTGTSGFYKGTGAEAIATFEPDGPVKLYYDQGTYSAYKLATTSTGIDVTGASGLDGATPPTVNIHSTSAGTWTDEAAFARLAFGNDDTAGGVSCQIEAYVDSTSGNNSGLRFFTSASANTPLERLRIDKSGNVGIGTSNPLSNLHVYDRDAPAELRLQRYEADGIMVNGDVIGSLLFHSNDDSANASGIRARIDAVIQSTAGQACIKFTTANSGDTEATVEKMRIQADGKVGIGTSSPTQKLHVTGDVVIDKTNNGYSGLRIHDDSGGDYNSYIDLGRNQSGTRLTIRYSGRVQGTTPWTNATASPICSFARGGIAFGSDTAAANTLDDYEEGTWTATFSVGSGSVTTHSSYDTGYYTKIGNKVFFYLHIRASATSSPSGALQITGLPYGSEGGISRRNAVTLNPIYGWSFPSGGIPISYVGEGSSVINIHSFSGGSASNAGSYINSNTELFINGSYTT